MKLHIVCGLVSVVCLFAHPAFAQTAYRCNEGGKTVYSDKPCANGTPQAILDSVPASPDAKQAQRQATQEKRDADRAVRERRKQIDQDFNAQQRAEAQAARQKKHCDRLALHSKWAKEKARQGGTVRQISKAETRQRQAEEAYALECK